MKQTFAGLAGCEADDAADIGIRLKVLAGELFSAYSHMEWLEKQVFPQTAQGQQLDCHAQQRGFTRKPAVQAGGSLTFARPAALEYDVEIPVGTVCAASGVNGVRAVTVQEAVLKAGSLSVTAAAQAQTGGKAGNVAANRITILITPPPGIVSVNNDVPFTGGSEGETDDELRGRILESYRNISNGTNAAFYRDCVLKYAGIRSVRVVPQARGTGTVDIYTAAKGGVPDGALLTQIRQELQSLREINVDVQVLPAELTAVNLYVNVTPEAGFVMEDVRTACKEALTLYFESLAIGEPVLLAAAGEALYHTPGVKNYSFVTGMCADRAVTEKQLAVAGELGIIEKQGV